MAYNVLTYVLLILFGATYSVLGATQKNDQSAIVISIADFNPLNQSLQVFSANISLNSDSKINIIVTDVSKSDIQFFVIQTHSYEDNIVLSNTETFEKYTYVNGSNIGLVQKVSSARSYTFYFKNELPQSNNSIFIAVLPYKLAPIPGGCNMEFMTEIAPYQRLQATSSVITVDAQIASLEGISCEMQIVRHEMYHMYLPEADYSSETYFDAIQKMLTVDDITTYGTQVSRSVKSYLRQLYNVYKGTGSVYVVVAYVNNSKSAYVPIVSFGCDINNWVDNCDSPMTVVSRILCSVLVFLGLFTCYFGHKFFKTEMFLVGSLVGGYICYLILCVVDNLSDRDAIIVSLIVGCVFGLVWLSFWWFFGIPVLSTLLSLIVLGFLFASVIFYAGLSDITVVRNDITYWGFFTCIVLLCVTILTGFMHKANILACGIVGAYAFILPLDHYYGTNLKYIFINTIRRATVANFGSAVIDAPYQWNDALLTVLWLFLAVTGVIYQWRHQQGRPPFPPTTGRLQLPDERTPLLVPTSNVQPSERVILIHSVPSYA